MTINKFQIRQDSDRGKADHGWLKTNHTFSFANYYDPDNMGFRSLRVINEDYIAPRGGFPMHPHRDMEIFSYIVSGSIKHEDTMGNSRILGPGDIQVMSAGSGIEHSETNPSSDTTLHLLQIWLTPNARGLTPTYNEWQPSAAQQTKNKILIISPYGAEASATINQDAYIYKVNLATDESITHTLAEGRGMWIQVVKGSITIDDIKLSAGDAIATEAAEIHSITTTSTAEFLLFDLH